jgi:DNA-binding transcriptional LysR family regulator
MDSLVIFEQAARHLSFTRAGAQLGLTQSAISRQIIDLEAMLNVALFSRSRRQLQLTEAGIEFKASIEPLLEGLETAVLKQQMRVTQGDALNLSVAVSFCSMWFVPHLPAYYRECKGQQINITPHVGFVSLAADKFDAAIVNTGALPAGYASMPLMNISCAPFAAPGLLPHRKGRTTLASQRKWPVLHLREFPAEWSRYVELAGLDHLTLTTTGVNSLFLLNYDAVKAGLGAALLPPEMVADDVVQGRLLRLHPMRLETNRSYHLMWQMGSRKEAELRRLGEWMRESLGSALGT